MKTFLWFVAFALMVWAVIEQSKPQPNLYIQVAGVVGFFFAMYQLSQRTSSEQDSHNQSNENQSDDETV